MALLAFLAFFTAGHAAFRRFTALETDATVAKVLADRVVRLLLPVGMLTMATVWAPNCDYLRGLLFVPLFPVITVVLAVFGAFFVYAFQIKFRYFVVAGVLISLGGPVYDLGLHPQFYTYNHVFGGVLGPIYDEMLAVRPGLFWFRGLTLLWAFLFYLAAKRKLSTERSMVRVGLVVLCIGFAYLFSAYLGFNTPSWYLQERLAGLRKSAHFSIHFDTTAADPQQVERWVAEHEFRYAQLKAVLKEEVEEEIHSYIYPDESTRAALTGARLTSVSPVWLQEPQLHVLEEQMGEVFSHELSHVFSRNFGISFLHASVSVGLVEGLAVATEPPDGRPTPHEMVAASELFRQSSPEVLAERVSSTLTPSGFWSGRGAVSYTVSGSFVKYLLERYGVEAFKFAYPAGAFSTIYGKSAKELALEWIAALKSLPLIDCAASTRANASFSVPSLFEQQCPHWDPPRNRRAVEADGHLRGGLAEEARIAFHELMTEHPAFQPALIGWSRSGIALGDYETVLDSLILRDRSTLSLEALGVLADAFALSGQADSASVLLESVRVRYPHYARDARALWTMRKLTASYPDILAVITSADAIELKRERLASVLIEREIETNHVSGPGILWSAILASEDDAFSDALAAIEHVLTMPEGPCTSRSEPDLYRICPVWAASFAYRVGDIETALAYASFAVDVAMDVGDLSLKRLLDDFLKKLRWLESNQSYLHR